ncbi:MAG: hypothetical protein ABJF10_27125 [Chthoniobacter sp.]|uniref:hypothetical protein n=1 Tax=Chthoniobacter sp. TaxID=2510640 RepID=UPI00326CC59A
MNHPQKRTKRKKGREPEPPAPMTLRDKAQIWAWIAGIFMIVGFAFHYFATRQQAATLDSEVHRWQSDYHLNDEQVRRIRAMEEGFHGKGDPFLRPAHTPGETRDHHRAMADVMNPEDGERFFKAQEGSAPSR